MGLICVLSLCVLVGMVLAIPPPLDMRAGLAQYPGMMSMIAIGNPYYNPSEQLQAQYNYKAAEAYVAAMNTGNTVPYSNLSPDEEAFLKQALLAYFFNLQNAQAEAAETYVLRSNEHQDINKKYPNNRRQEEE